MIGTRDIQPPDAKFPKPFKVCSVRFGPPVSPERYRDRDDHLALRQMIDEVMFCVRELSGQQYVDAYATKKAEGLPTDVAKVESINGRTDTPRRSSADVLNPTGAVAASH
jgi:1-acyl-sn-glycerol-3-phosphate acyltransferase